MPLKVKDIPFGTDAQQAIEKAFVAGGGDASAVIDDYGKYMKLLRSEPTPDVLMSRRAMIQANPELGKLHDAYNQTMLEASKPIARDSAINEVVNRPDQTAFDKGIGAFLNPGYVGGVRGAVGSGVRTAVDVVRAPLTESPTFSPLLQTVAGGIGQALYSGSKALNRFGVPQVGLPYKEMIGRVKSDAQALKEQNRPYKSDIANTILQKGTPAVAGHLYDLLGYGATGEAAIPLAGAAGVMGEVNKDSGRGLGETLERAGIEGAKNAATTALFMILGLGGKGFIKDAAPGLMAKAGRALSGAIPAESAAATRIGRMIQMAYRGIPRAAAATAGIAGVNKVAGRLTPKNLAGERDIVDSAKQALARQTGTSVYAIQDDDPRLKQVMKTDPDTIDLIQKYKPLQEEEYSKKMIDLYGGETIPPVGVDTGRRMGDLQKEMYDMQASISAEPDRLKRIEMAKRWNARNDELQRELEASRSVGSQVARGMVSAAEMAGMRGLFRGLPGGGTARSEIVQSTGVEPPKPFGKIRKFLLGEPKSATPPPESMPPPPEPAPEQTPSGIKGMFNVKDEPLMARVLAEKRATALKSRGAKSMMKQDEAIQNAALADMETVAKTRNAPIAQATVQKAQEPVSETKPMTQAEALKRVRSPKLPADLKGAKPNYSYRDKRFNLAFASDIDRAAYITAQEKRSRRDADYVQFVSDATGLSEADVRAMGADVKARIKAMARDAEPGTLRVPDQGATPKKREAVIEQETHEFVVRNPEQQAAVETKVRQINLSRASKRLTPAQMQELTLQRPEVIDRVLSSSGWQGVEVTRNTFKKALNDAQRYQESADRKVVTPVEEKAQVNASSQGYGAHDYANKGDYVQFKTDGPEYYVERADAKRLYLMDTAGRKQSIPRDTPVLIKGDQTQSANTQVNAQVAPPANPVEAAKASLKAPKKPKGTPKLDKALKGLQEKKNAQSPTISKARETIASQNQPKLSVNQAVEQKQPVKFPIGTTHVRVIYRDGKKGTVPVSDVETLAIGKPILKVEALQKSAKAGHELVAVSGEITVK